MKKNRSNSIGNPQRVPDPSRDRARRAKLAGSPRDRKARPARKASKAKKAEAALRKFALGFPGTREEFPWGDRVVKVGKKVFVFMGTTEDGGFGLSVKLPASGPMALLLPFASPTGYGLGKSGWVSAQFGPSDAPPLDMLCAWIDESYRAVAPKKLVSGLK